MRNTILYIGGFEPPNGNAAAQRVLSNAKLFKSLGHDVILLGVSKTETLDNILSTKTNIGGFSSYLYGYPRSIKDWILNLVSIREVLKVIKDQESNSKVSYIVAYNFPSIALMRLFKFARKNNIKLISDCTEWQVIFKPRTFKDIVKNIDTSFRMRYVHCKIDGLITISQFLTDYYRKCERILVQLPPLVDKNDKKWQHTEKTQNINVFRLLYVGSPGNGSKDRIDLILEGLESIINDLDKRIDFQIVGLTEKEYFKIYNKTKIPEGIKSHITFRGRLSHTEALHELKNADFSIFLRAENIVTKAGFPTKFVDSITCGTPVLTNTSSNIDHYLTPGKEGFILDISNSQSLQDSLKNALNSSSSVVQTMKEYCQSVNRFHTETYKEEVNEFLKQVDS